MRSMLPDAGGKIAYQPLAEAGTVDHLPYTIRILLESALRNRDGFRVTDAHVAAIAGWTPHGERSEIPFLPGRVLLQDFTGVPAVVDLAAMRDAVARLGGDPAAINPQVPCDLVIDHSGQVDHYGDETAFHRNLALEFQRNTERYAFLRWGQHAFRNFRVVPPAMGIIHQINLEYLASVVLTKDEEGMPIAFPDSLVGTDSHTTMINGAGVLGWGVGGIEAEAVMLGQPISMLLPDVVGFELTGALPAGVTATDLVLTVVQMLRRAGVVDKFVEFFGDGLDHLSLADRATVANMAPEYGATCGFFPVDDETIRYLRLTGRENSAVDLVAAYCKAQGLYRTTGVTPPTFSATLRLDMGSVEPCLAGPKRPQDRLRLAQAGSTYRAAVTAPVGPAGLGLDGQALSTCTTVDLGGTPTALRAGAVVIAAITSCTNTSNPAVMLTAGLLARNAVARGLTVPAWVKTSLAPGSRAVSGYLDRAGLTPALETLGFHTVGYGCTTCIGNGGTLRPEIVQAIDATDLVTASVTSGNRNFEGRICPHVKVNFLASPPLVVAFALAGTVDIDLTTDALGTAADGQAVYLADIWPADDEIRQAIATAVTRDLFVERYADVFTGPKEWQAIAVPTGERFAWDPSSTYIQNPPFFTTMQIDPSPPMPITGARALALLGDSVTTDHISPAGAIPPGSPAATHLESCGVAPADFNQFGSRRGNDRVMTRGTFGNIRLRNQLLPGSEGGVTRHLPDGAVCWIFEAAERYRDEDVPLIVLAGKEYGTGSSRDWAAKGVALLGVRAVIAESFERIHRSNLVGMGVLPLQFSAGDTAASLGLTGTEFFTIAFPEGDFAPGQTTTVTARTDAGQSIVFAVTVRINTPVEVDYYRNGGILQTVIRKLL